MHNFALINGRRFYKLLCDLFAHNLRGLAFATVFIFHVNAIVA